MGMRVRSVLLTLFASMKNKPNQRASEQNSQRRCRPNHPSGMFRNSFDQRDLQRLRCAKVMRNLCSTVSRRPSTRVLIFASSNLHDTLNNRRINTAQRMPTHAWRLGAPR